METPGHTHGSITVVADTNEGRVAAAGDALPTLGNYQKWVPPGINFDRRTALISMEKIVDAADIIVPGHDDKFRPDQIDSKRVK